MGDDPTRLYRLDGVAHIAGVINEEMAGLYHLTRLNDRWFRLDEALDVAYQLGLLVDGRYVSGCLSEFHIYIEGGRPSWVWFQELLGVIPPPSQVQKYAVNCSWFQETFGECPEDADDDTVRRYARAYIMMLLGTLLFADKSGNRIHIRWLPYVARLEELGTYSWGSAALAWLYQCMCRVANRHVVKLAGPLQLLQSWIFWHFPRFRPAGYEELIYITACPDKGEFLLQFIWMPYSSPDVLQVVHPEVLEPRHMALWRSVTALIYFAVIEWHQIDRVLPQFGGVQPPPHPALNIDFLMSKDGRGGDRWFPSTLQKWHLLWDSRQDCVLRFDVVADPGPSHAFLDWWSQHGKRFLSPETQLGILEQF
ncbi:serine/threonine-protein phosphatase 7 long form homolog [Arachis hypogaea]|uniref:serine/threonine-protein phosphatase 7 long form homolog n=1 Tax=Arachis hypogaea TaxID=3818 RepID=UPI003B225BC4